MSSARDRNFVLQTIGMVWPSAVLLPQLRGAWLFSSINAGGDLIDTSGHGKTLTNTGTVTFSNDDYMPYGILNGSSQYFTRGDEAHFDITGAHTILSWDYYDDTASTEEVIAGKWTIGGNQRSYILGRDGDGTYQAIVSDNGTNETTVNSTQVVASGNWTFGASRYNPSTELAVFVGYQGADEGILEKSVNTTSIPASLFNSNADFTLGALNISTTPDKQLAGRKAMTFLCAAALSDNFINMIYSQSRTILGV